MNSVKIIIATAMILVATNLLSGCTSKHVSEVGIERIAAAQEMKKTRPARHIDEDARTHNDAEDVEVFGQKIVDMGIRKDAKPDGQ